MARLSQSQVQMYAQSAGLSADRARIAAAVAMAESSGNTQAHNPVPPDNSYGLWQINMLGSLGPDRRRKLGISSNEALFDPAVNARAMAMISSGGSNFGPWSTYTNGAYKKYLNGAVDPALDLPDIPGVTGIPGLPVPDAQPLSGLTALAELGIGASQWMSDPHNWVRVIQVTVGALMVGVGLAVMTKGAWQPAQQAMTKVASVTPIGRTAKAVKAAPKSAPKVKAPA